MRPTALSLTSYEGFHFASQYSAIVHSSHGQQHEKHRDATALLLPRTNRQCVARSDCSLCDTQPMADRLTGCSVRLQGWLSSENTPALLLTPTELRPTNNETTSWLRFVCQLTVSRPVNSLCKVLFQLSLTVLVCYRCRSRITNSLTSSLPRTLSCTLKQLDSNNLILLRAPSTIRGANACTVWGLHPLWLN